MVVASRPRPQLAQVWESVQTKPPKAMAMEPPGMSVFSKRMTFSTPASIRRAAASRPAVPAPMMTTSTSSVTSSGTTSGASGAAEKSARSPPASLMASETPCLMAVEVMVAPETSSTFTLWASTMRPGIRSTA